jgi:hypothetical protein
MSTSQKSCLTTGVEAPRLVSLEWSAIPKQSGLYRQTATFGTKKAFFGSPALFWGTLHRDSGPLVLLSVHAGAPV